MTTTKKSTITTVVRSIPEDLIIEILLKLPAKSVFRFRSVSKSWKSIISSQQFIDDFTSVSLSRPRLLLILQHTPVDHRVLFFSSSHLSRSSLLSSSSILVAKHNTFKDPEVEFVSSCTSVRGFVCFRPDDGFIACNPTTKQFIHIAVDDRYNCCYLGYDPNGNQYKVLCVGMDPFGSKNIEHNVLTFGGQESSDSWRPIKANIPYYQFHQNNVCIDGVLYYRCIQNHLHDSVCCFDVGSEQLRIIAIPNNNLAMAGRFVNYLAGSLVNYLGKLAVFHNNETHDNENGGFILWVLDDVKNEVWSKKTCVFSSSTQSVLMNFRFQGITEFGEIVYLPCGPTYADSFYIFCYHVEKKMERRVKIQGLPEKCLFDPSSILCSYVDNINYL